MAGSHDGRVTLSTKLDTSGIAAGAKGIKSALSASCKAVVALGAAAAGAIVAVTKESVEAYAAYEQLAGGVETLFKQSADKVKAYAENAYKTAGVSANAYMETVTSFSASLISSLRGNTEEAAEVANMAITDMSDNANKMGTPLANIQNAYQGFAKQNYTMLDNLKLGYGGTKTEMERLLKDAEAFSGVKYDINNLSDVYKAIHQIQVKLDIAGTTAKEAESTISGSAAMTKSAWENLLTAMSGGGSIDRAIENLVYSIEKYMQNIVPVVERSLVGIGYAIERLAPLLVERIAVALIKAIPSLLNAVYKMIIGLAKGIYQGIKALFAGGTTEKLEEQAEKIKVSVENQKDLTEEIKETEKAAKKALAGFDELNILSQGSTNNAEVGDYSNLPVDVDTGDAVSGGSPLGIDGTELTSEIEKTLAEIMVIAGNALVAIGLILVLTGHVAWGIGFIIAGAALFGVGAAALTGDTISPTVMSTLTLIMGAVAGALIAIGIILIMVGSTGLGIGFIAAGAALLGITIYTITQFSADPIKDTLLLIEAIAGGAMLALGILLLYFGVNKPLAIGLIVAGAAVLAVAVAQIVAGAVSEEVAAWIYGITAIVSTALLVIGIIMLCTGHITPLAIGLVVAGAAGLATTAAINWNTVVDAVRGPIGKIVAIVSASLLALGIILLFVPGAQGLGLGLLIAGAAGLAATAAFNWNAIVDAIRGPIGRIVAIVSAALLVLGIILLFVPGAQGLGLGLLIAGAAGLATTVAFNWDSIVDSIKGAWQKIKDFWNNHIAKFFTAKWWGDLAKSAINGFLRWIFNGLNSLIDKLNSFGFKLPDILGGGRIGFNIKKLDIPQLAKGAVLPANKPFLAMVGDQKHGTNIEAPLSTIQEAVDAVMEGKFADMMDGFAETVAVLREILEAVYGIQIGDDVLGQAVSRYNRKMNIARGGPL